MISMLGCWPASTSLGDRMHMEQSFVGNVLSSIAMMPPIEGPLSIRYALNPDSARSSAACIPPIPPPTTRTEPLSAIFLLYFAFVAPDERFVVLVHALLYLLY